MEGSGHMDNDFREKAARFLTLFGLDASFTPDELASSYRALARLNHPDVARDVAAGMRMVIINEGYEFLKSARPLIQGGAVTAETGAGGKSGSGEIVYRQYRKAFDILREAFDDYFGRPGRRGEGDIGLLRERLSVAKDEFAAVINGFPYNEWVDDAIDRINSINRWLG